MIADVTEPADDGERTDDAAMQAAAEVPVPGERVGRYTVIEPLGEGAMGVVLRAYDAALDREVALKVVRPPGVSSSEKLELARGRLVAEARALARLSHPNVVAVYEVGMHRGQIYVAMELVRGVDLQRWLRIDGPRPWREVVEVFLAVGRGLAAVHAAGMVHRDVKPANILVGDDGRARVGDFGIARAVVELEPPQLDGYELSAHDLARTAVTAQGRVVGTPAYMAPEQHERGEAGPAADQFAFCVALVEALWGARPYQVELRRMAAAKRAGPRLPSSRRRVPAHLWPIVARGLSPDPVARFPSMDALCDALARDPRVRRRRLLAGGLVGLAGVGALALVLARPGPCEAAQHGLDGVWDAASRAALADAFGRSDHPWAPQAWDHASAQIDAWSGQWLAMHRETCELGLAGPPDDLLDRRHACLTARRRGLVAVTGALAEATPDVIDHAFELVTQLRPVAPCGDAAVLASAIELPEDEGTRERVELVREELARGRTWVDAGRYREAIELGDRAVVEARSLEYAPLLAESLTFLGDAHQQVGEEPQARAVLEEGVWRAVEIGHDEVASEAAIALVWSAGRRGNTIDEALRWGELARSQLNRRADDPRAEFVRLEHGLGAALDTAARYDEALVSYARALELAQGDASLVVVTAVIHASIAKLYGDRGELAAARAELEPAIATLEPILGRDHPQLARMRGQLAILLDATGEYDRAVELFAAVVEGNRLAMGDDAPRVATARANLAVALGHAGRKEEELAMNELALASLERNGDSLGAATVLGNLGLEYFSRGIYDAAEQRFERSLAMLERLYPPDHPELVAAIIGLGRVRIAQRAYDRAIDLFDRAEAIVMATQGRWSRLRGLALEGRGAAEIEAGRLEAAEATLLEQLEVVRHAPDAAPRDETGALRDLARLRREQGREAEARALESEATAAAR